MSDRYSQLVRLPVAGTVAKRVGLPQPVSLERGGEFTGRVLLGGAGRLAGPAARVLAAMGADAATALDDPVRALAAEAGLDAAVFNPLAPADQRFKALVFDATGAELIELHRFFHPTVRRVRQSGRVIVLGDGRRALEGFTRSLGKEIGRGATVNLVHVEEGAPIDATLRFLLSPRSAYVSGQVIRVGRGEDAPLAGRHALVTGAARGIGAAIADACSSARARRWSGSTCAMPSTEVHVGDELVWGSTSTNLKRGDGDASIRDDWTFEDPPITAWWTLPDASAAATPVSPATTTRSTCTRGRRSPSASRAPSPTGCGRRRAA